MRVTFDPSVDAAFISLKAIRPGEAAWQHVVDDAEARGTIILDFDESGRLIGIEVLNATEALPQSVIDNATRI